MTKEQLNIVQDIFRFCVNARNDYEGLTCGDAIFALSTVISDFIIAGASDTEEAKEMLQKELDKISDYGIEIKAKNGEYYVEFSTFTNHLGTDFKELFGMINFGVFILKYSRVQDPGLNEVLEDMAAVRKLGVVTHTGH